MKYCPHCGAELVDDAVVCVKCGRSVAPLAWCLPITISIFNRLRDKRPVGTGLKVCALLFVNLIGGICLLCMHDDR